MESNYKPMTRKRGTLVVLSGLFFGTPIGAALGIAAWNLGLSLVVSICVAALTASTWAFIAMFAALPKVN
jgi:hypothetical protein